MIVAQESPRFSNPGIPGGELSDKNLPERPTNGYIGVVLREGTLHVDARNGSNHEFTIPFGEDPLSTALPSLFSRLNGIDPLTHWRSLGIAGVNGDGRDFAAESWMEHGTPTIVFEGGPDTDTSTILDSIKTKHTEYGIRKVDIDPDGRVHSSRLARFEDYKPLTPEAVWKENVGDDKNRGIIRNAAIALKDSVVVDDNTTAQAGGVAGMNHPKQRFIDDFNEVERAKIAKGEEGHLIDYRWLRTDDRIDASIAAKYGIDLADPELLTEYGDSDPEDPRQRKINIFKLTKKRHVLLQDDAEPEERYTEKDDRLYHAWSETQYELNTKPALEKLRALGKHIVLKEEDQQTWGKIPFIRRDFPEGVDIIARNHIHSHAELARDPSTPQHAIVESILKDLEHGIDAFMAHRSNDQHGRDEFLFRDAAGNIDRRIADKTMYSEASFDDLDGLGRPLTEAEKPILYTENNYNLYQSGQTPDNFDIPGIGIYARDDESKDKITGMLAYIRFAKQMQQEGVPMDEIPMYRDIAMGAADDPSGGRIHAAYLIGLHPELAQRTPQEIRDSFKPADYKVMERLQEALAENQWIANKIKKFRFTYDQYEDRNRRAIEETCMIAGQFSTAEACEDQISRWIAGNPENGGTYTVTSNVGGMTPQVEDGVSGRIIDKTGDDREIDAIAHEFYWYFTEIHPDPEVRKTFRQKVRAALKPQYTTVHNVARELGAAALVRQSKDRIPAMVQQHLATTGHFPFVHDLLDEYKPLPLELPTHQDIFHSPASAENVQFHTLN